MHPAWQSLTWNLEVSLDSADMPLQYTLHGKASHQLEKSVLACVPVQFILRGTCATSNLEVRLCACMPVQYILRGTCGKVDELSMACFVGGKRHIKS